MYEFQPKQTVLYRYLNYIIVIFVIQKDVSISISGITLTRISQPNTIIISIKSNLHFYQKQQLRLLILKGSAAALDLVVPVTMSTTITTSSGSPDTLAPPYIPGTLSIAYVTTPNVELAKQLARGLVEQRLAACVNIVPDVTSVYRWDGKIQEDSEVMLIVKTATDRVAAVSEYVRANHVYEVPEVISAKIENGNEAYLRFVNDTIKSVNKD